MNTDTMFSSEDNKWMTPKWLCDEVSKFFGGNFLDPAAPLDDPTYTGATRHFTEKDNGLVQDWRGKVYVNPPYGREITQWAEKFMSEYFKGHMTEGMILLPARTDTQWWAYLVRHSPTILFFYGRLTFEGAENSAPFPSALMYMGNKRQYFTERFLKKGWFSRVVGT